MRIPNSLLVMNIENVYLQKKNLKKCLLCLYNLSTILPVSLYNDRDFTGKLGPQQIMLYKGSYIFFNGHAIKRVEAGRLFRTFYSTAIKHEVGGGLVRP